MAIRRRYHGPRGYVKGQPSVPPPPADSREAAIIADIERRFNLESGAVYRWTRQPAICQARQTVMWALSQTGLSVAQIGRLFGREHSTVAHGIRRVEAHPEWREIARPALYLVGAGGQRQALAAWLDQGFPSGLSAGDRCAVHAYATCTLLGWEHQPPHVCSYGMLLVLGQQSIRTALEEALRRVEAACHIERIAWHAARLARAV